jgi:hypothetical protein
MTQLLIFDLQFSIFPPPSLVSNICQRLSTESPSKNIMQVVCGLPFPCGTNPPSEEIRGRADRIVSPAAG